MRRKLLILILLLAAFITQGFSQAVAKGDKLLNFGIGIGSSLYSDTYYKVKMPPISASMEFIINDNMLNGNAAIGIGPYVGLSTYNFEFSGSGWKYTSILIGPKATFHYNFIDKLDTYAGVSIVYDIVSSSSIGTPASGTDRGSELRWGAYVGARYFFTDNLGVMAELGLGITNLNLGITLKLHK